VSISENEVVAAEAKRSAAMIVKDVGALDGMLMPDLIWSHSTGAVDDKAAFLGRIADGAVRYVSIERTAEHIRIYGDAAIVTGVAAVKVIVDGAEIDMKNNYTNVWVKAGGMLRLATCQSTKTR
jgi:hypothetical protein